MVYTIGSVWRLLNHIETNPYTTIISEYISLNSGLWSNLLRKTAITTAFYFPADEESVCIRRKIVKCK